MFQAMLKQVAQMEHGAIRETIFNPGFHFIRATRYTTPPCTLRVQAKRGLSERELPPLSLYPEGERGPRICAGGFFQSMKGIINLFRKLQAYAFHIGQVFDACAGDTLQTAELFE